MIQGNIDGNGTVQKGAVSGSAQKIWNRAHCAAAFAMWLSACVQPYEAPMLASDDSDWPVVDTERTISGLSFSGYQIFSAPGAYTFSPPAGVRQIRVSVWGAGGGGGAGSSTAPYAGSGGGGGGFAESTLDVVDTDVFAVNVGAGGAGAIGQDNADGANGGDSTFSGGGLSAAIIATGGLGGTQANATGPGLGGTASNAMITRVGGQGGPGASWGSGAGGSAGGPYQQGVNAALDTPYGSGGAATGASVALSRFNRQSGGGGSIVGWSSAGVAGGFPGAGGGGAWGYTVFPPAGAGANGAIMIEY